MSPRSWLFWIYSKVRNLDPYAKTVIAYFIFLKLIFKKQNHWNMETWATAGKWREREKNPTLPCVASYEVSSGEVTWTRFE